MKECREQQTLPNPLCNLWIMLKSQPGFLVRCRAEPIIHSKLLCGWILLFHLGWDQSSLKYICYSKQQLFCSASFILLCGLLASCWLQMLHCGYEKFKQRSHQSFVEDKGAEFTATVCQQLGTWSGSPQAFSMLHIPPVQISQCTFIRFLLQFFNSLSLFKGHLCL